MRVALQRSFSFNRQEAVTLLPWPARPQLSDKLPIHERLASLELNQVHNPSLCLYVCLYVALRRAECRMAGQHLHVLK
jgi:hypothetical protein